MACDPIKATLHCVGVCVMSNDLGPCLLMMQSMAPGGLYCVSLTRETSDLVSPLYEHILLLEPQQTTSHPLLTFMTGETHFIVHQRLGCRYRLDSQYKQKDLEKKMRELIGNTFFLDMDRSYSAIDKEDTAARRLLNSLFSETPGRSLTHYAYWDCREEADVTVLLSYLALFKEAAEKRYKNKKTLYENYWLAAQPLQKEILTHGVAQLMMYTKSDTLFQKTDILTLFNNWKQYKAVASYFMHRMQSIDATYGLYKLIRPEPSLLDTLWLMPCGSRIAFYNFCGLIKRLCTATEPVSLDTKELNLALFDTVLAGRLYTLLRVIINHYEEDYEQRALTDALKLPILIQCMMARLEQMALSRTTLNKATLDAITVENIYATYHALTSTNPPLTMDEGHFFDLEATELSSDEKPKNLDSDSESEDTTMDMDLWSHSMRDFGIVLAGLYRHIKAANLPQWHINPQKGNNAKAKSVLFFISPDTAALTAEKNNRLLYDKYIHGRATVSLRFNDTSPTLDGDSWQSEWQCFKEVSESQSYQFVLFSPDEVMREDDLTCLKTMLFADLHNTSIMRNTSDVFFLKRFSHYFAHNQQDLRTTLLHKDYCFGVEPSFTTIKKEAVKETILVPQCHTFSVMGMQNLLKWLIFNQKTIRRVVMLGAPFILPSPHHGQAFLDLLRLGHAQQIGGPLYNKEARGDEFALLLENHWRFLKTTRTSTALQQQETMLKNSGYHVARSVKDESDLLNELDKTITVTTPIYCLYKCSSLNNKARTKNFLYDGLDGNMSAKQKGRLKLQSLDVDHLHLHNCITIATALFVVSRKTLLALDKNQLFYVFMLLEKLYIVEGASSTSSDSDSDLMSALVTTFREKTRPNIRYSYVSIK